jgi:hypothetical protein
MKPTTVLRWITWVSLGTLAACGGVSSIGSGDDPGKAGMSSGGTKGTAGNGTGAKASGGNSTGATGTGASANVAGSPSTTIGGATQVELCKTDPDCTGFGAPCEPCLDGSFACNKTYCDGAKCVQLGTTCPTKCASDKDCPVPDLPCADCGDGTKACPTSQCLMDQCQTSFPGCGNEDPCKGQACGAECKACTNGMCGTVASYCSAEGKCQPGLPQCADPGMCSTAKDCGAAPPKCVPCGNDICATFDCIKGSCVFACPPNPGPQCKVSEDCPAVGDACKMCPSGKCALQACLQGSCELVCPL